MQHCWPTTPNIVGCYMLRPFAHPVACCWMLLRVVAQSLKPIKLFSQQLPTFLLFPDRRSVAQQCWICLFGFYPSHDALQVPILLGVVASVCTQPYHSNENSSVVHSRSTIHFVSSSNFWVYGGNPMVLPFKRNLFSSTFTWYYLFSM